VVRWRLVDLVQWLWEEFRITISAQTLSRELRALNYRKLSARPRHHAKSDTEVDAFKIYGPAVRRKRAASGWKGRFASIYPASVWSQSSGPLWKSARTGPA
jgi:hypothetical protein